MPLTWIVLDFSGTLSLRAALFGQAQRLEQALDASSLRALGVRDAAFFWSQIVAPTWEEGSTTRKGYQRVLCERLKALGAVGTVADEGACLAAAGRFVEQYLNDSTIDPAWGPLLRHLQSRPDVRLIVATDHYAEATAHILRQLQSLGVAAAPAQAATRGREVLVANSAEIGHHKVSPAFWAALRASQPTAPTTILVVDDFGANENPQDRYADAERVQARQRQTIACLASVLGAQVLVFAFALYDRPRPATSQALERRYRALIRRAGQFLCAHLPPIPRAPAVDTTSA